MSTVKLFELKLDEDIKLNAAQTKAKEVLETGRSVYLYGKGGTGKTFLAELWKLHQRECHVEEGADTPPDDWWINTVFGADRLIIHEKFKKRVTIPINEVAKNKAAHDHVAQLQSIYISNEDTLSEEWMDFMNKHGVVAIKFEERHKLKLEA